MEGSPMTEKKTKAAIPASRTVKSEAENDQGASSIQAAQARRGRGAAEATVQLNARISLTVEGHLQETLQHTGMLKRAVVEQALTEFWEREVNNAR